MPVSAGALRDLHRIHRQCSDLRERLARGPKQIQAGERSVQQLTGELDQAKQTHTKARILSDDKQLQLKEREDRVEKLKLQLNTCASNKEYQALKEQIAADQQANSVLSDEILETLDKIEHIEVEVKAADEKLTKATEELEKIRKRVAMDQASLETDLARVSAELEKAEAALPGDFKADYERQVKAKGEDALAMVEGETCGGCYQVLTPQTLAELQMSKPVFCKACGRLLYLPEDTAFR